MHDPEHGLFGRPPAAVEPAAQPPEVQALARRLPGGLRLGASSWSFPGWTGLVWDRTVSSDALAAEGLPAYARHPLLRTVGVDRAWYRPLTAKTWRDLFEDVPADFAPLVKAAAACTRPVTRDGSASPQFLDPGWTEDVVLGPIREGLGQRDHVVLFQFSAMSAAQTGDPAAFAQRVGAFLEALPDAHRYAVEVRDRRLLTHAWADALRAGGAAHAINVYPGMPTVTTQARVAAAVGAPHTVVRWMLRPDRRYAEAKAAFAPFDRLVAPHPEVRNELAELLATLGSAPAWVIANNKAEGSAPLSLLELARCLA